MPASQMFQAIADWNETHGVSGVTVRGKTFSNDDLRLIDTYRAGWGGVEWVEANVGRSFKRPNGTMVYTVLEVIPVYRGWRTFINVRCSVPQGERQIAWTELKKMERVA